MGDKFFLEIGDVCHPFFVGVILNHKRKHPKNQRSGCLMCKYWKMNGFGKERPDWERFSDHKRRMFAKEDSKLGERI